MFALIVIVMLSGTLKKTNKQTKNQHITRAHLPGHCEHSVCCLEERTSLSLPGLHRRKWGEMLCAQGHVIPHRETHIYPVMLSVLVCAYTHTNTLFQQTGYWQGATESEILPCPLASFPALPGYSTDAHRHARMQADALCFSVQPTILLRSSLTLCLKVVVFLFCFFSFFVPFLVKNLTMLS